MMRYVLQRYDGVSLPVGADEEGNYTVVDGQCPKCLAPLRVVGRGAVTGFGVSPETILATEFLAQCRACDKPIGFLQSAADSNGAA